MREATLRRPPSGARSAAVALVLCVSWLGAQQPEPAAIRPLSHTQFVLANGLIGILNEDHATPLVAINVWYHFGSRDDAPGHAGMAHLCEHLTSQGSPHLAKQQQAFYRSIGGTATHWGETTEDVTKFSVVVPSNQLETVLWAESDRMAAPLSLSDERHLVAMQSIVAQERHQNIENITFGVSRELTLAALFPPGHPYHSEDPTAASLAGVTSAEVGAACGRYYVPNNAVIALSGDFDSKNARRLTARYFGAIPRGRAVTRTASGAKGLQAEQRLVLEDPRATQPELHLDWIGASYADHDRPGLVALASSLAPPRAEGLTNVAALTRPRIGRLTKLLVVDRQLAATVTADNYDLEAAGIFEIAVVPRPGASMTLIEALIDSTLASLETTPITREEIARFNAANTVEAAVSLQTKPARADTLAHDQVFAGDPVSYAKQAVAAGRLTPADVERIAQRFLTPARIVMSLVPAGRLDLVSRPDLPYRNVTPGSPGSARP